jgi:nucleoside-diphosphate-sugar epimerase
MITPLTIASMIKRGQGYLPRGDAAWHHVHVHDLSDLFIRLIRAAAKGGGKATWNEEGYYLAESERMGWPEYCRAAHARIAQAGYISRNDEGVPVWDIHEAVEQVGGLAGIFYSTSLGASIRARKLLGWDPKGKSVVDDMVDVIALEAKALGKLPQE